MYLRSNDDDAIESLAEAVFGKKLGLALGLAYDLPINSCAFPGCGMPCAGVFCLDHATT